MKHDVFDVPLGLLREWSAGGSGGLDRYSDNGRLVYAGVQVGPYLADLIADGERLLDRYVVAESYATFGGYRYGRVYVHPALSVSLDDAEELCDWIEFVDFDSIDGTVNAGFGYEVEIWHIVEDAPSADLAPELPAMALEVIRQLMEAGELGDPGDLTDEDFVSTPCRTEDLPLAVVTLSGSDDDVMRRVCEFLNGDRDPDWNDAPDDSIYREPMGNYEDWPDADYYRPSPWDTWHEIDIQPSELAVL